MTEKMFPDVYLLIYTAFSHNITIPHMLPAPFISAYNAHLLPHTWRAKENPQSLSLVLSLEF